LFYHTHVQKPIADLFDKSCFHFIHTWKCWLVIIQHWMYIPIYYMQCNDNVYSDKVFRERKTTTTNKHIHSSYCNLQLFICVFDYL